MSKELVERAAKHVAALNGHSDDWERYMEEAADYVNFVRAAVIEECAAYVEGKGGKIPGASVFASLVSRDNQPCMSGDARDRLPPRDREAFDFATEWLANRIRALAALNKGDAGE